MQVFQRICSDSIGSLFRFSSCCSSDRLLSLLPSVTGLLVSSKSPIWVSFWISTLEFQLKVLLHALTNTCIHVGIYYSYIYIFCFSGTVSACTSFVSPESQCHLALKTSWTVLILPWAALLFPFSNTFIQQIILRTCYWEYVLDLPSTSLSADKNPFSNGNLYSTRATNNTNIKCNYCDSVETDQN